MEKIQYSGNELYKYLGCIAHCKVDEHDFIGTISAVTPILIGDGFVNSYEVQVAGGERLNVKDIEIVNITPPLTNIGEAEQKLLMVILEYFQQKE